jgi:hypothetical protein
MTAKDSVLWVYIFDMRKGLPIEVFLNWLIYNLK